MRSDPIDIAAAIQLSRATVRKMKQNLGWASFDNVVAIPIATGVLFPSAGIELRPEWSALSRARAPAADSHHVVKHLDRRREIAEVLTRRGVGCVAGSPALDR